jgi:hypothetical protein
MRKTSLLGAQATGGSLTTVYTPGPHRPSEKQVILKRYDVGSESSESGVIADVRLDGF